MTWTTFQQRLQQMVEMVMMVVLVEMMRRIRKEEIMAREQVYMTHSQMLGKFEYTGGPIFKVVLEC